MRSFHFLAFIFISSTFIACNNSNKYQGDSILNYPDMQLIIKDYLLEYEKLPNTFLKLHIENGKKDSTYVNATQIDWKEINGLFEKANLYQKQLDKQYIITVISDTLNPIMTLLYTSINPKNEVQKLSINAENTDNKIKSIYWESRNDGFFNSEEKKVLYVVGQTLQIQEFSKKPFVSAKKKIIQYVFLNS
ncbi:MAG: hypothetical protein IPH46_11715 [Bacteroidetes bacterium]|jgi:hypothetical protein|nr:hypothetical protein [Bacteroidota bacterium]MBK9482162.1 hypothetical protein [Bacteroidota bacterium]HQW47792.1 hypothetical protein [Chitinophagaceae bacterium]